MKDMINNRPDKNIININIIFGFNPIDIVTMNFYREKIYSKNDLERLIDTLPEGNKNLFRKSVEDIKL